MKFISICSGIEAASVAFDTIGWKAVAFSEIEPFPSTLLAHHYPDIPNFGDMTKFKEWPEEVFAQADIIVGGPPCQSFSVAGRREGLNDDRGNLTLIYTELIEHADNIRLKHGKPPVIIIYENVPGLLSDKTGAFGCFLGALAGEDCELQPAGKRWSNAGCVYGPKRAIAWRVLDAQHFGLAQRRKRVFVVASARDGFDPSKILFEFKGVRRDIAPSREQRQKTTGDAGASFTASSFGQYREGVGTLRAAGGDLGGGSETLVTGFRKLTFESYAQDETASTMMARDYKSYTDLVAYGIPGNWIGRKPENGGNSTQFMHEIAPAQTATDKHGVIAFNSRQDPVSGGVFGALDMCSPQAQAVVTCATKQQAMTTEENMASTLAANDYKEPQAVAVSAYRADTAVRRLTPIECERLQGFPDGYTAIPWRNKPAEDCPDGHRYKALGNSMAVPCMLWLGQRIQVAL